MRDLGRVLSFPKPDQPSPLKCKKYLLRGIVTSPTIVYVCRRTEQNLVEVSEKPDDQWWRLEYRASTEPAVLAQVTSPYSLFFPVLLLIEPFFVLVENTTRNCTTAGLEGDRSPHSILCHRRCPHRKTRAVERPAPLVCQGRQPTFPTEPRRGGKAGD